MPAEKPPISVIVPVFNQWDLVPNLIECLKAQTCPASSLELLLVDNGSDWLPDTGDEPDFVRRLSCLTPGSYAARNHGAANAAGDLFVFTDADCLPEPRWLEAISQCVSNGDATIVAGCVKVVANGPLTLAARYDLALGFPQERYVSRGYGVTANLSMPRAVFQRAGGFDARRLSGGDAEFCRRAAGFGVKTVYCPDARVAHPARRSMGELTRKVRRVKGGQLRNGPLRMRIAYAVRAFLPPLRAWWRIWRSNLPLGERLAISLVQIRLWLAEMAEVIRLLAWGEPERR